MSSELVISGIGVSREVVSDIVSMAAERVEGVASVGENAIASGLISVFTAKPVSTEPAGVLWISVYQACGRRASRHFVSCG